MDGTSFVDTFDDPDADERHTVQYFESMGNRAIYKDGWWACARLDRIPWDFTPATMKRFAPGRVRPGGGHLGAVQPRPTTSHRRWTWPRNTRRSWPS